MSPATERTDSQRIESLLTVMQPAAATAYLLERRKKTLMSELGVLVRAEIDGERMDALCLRIAEVDACLKLAKEVSEATRGAASE